MRATGQLTIRFVLISAAVLFGSGMAQAVDRHWNVGSGLWSQSASWTPAAIPSGLDNAIIDYFGATGGGFARLTTPQVPAVTSVTITNSATLTLSGSLTAGSLLVGDDVLVGANSFHGQLNILSSSPFVVFTGGMTIVDQLRVGVLSGSGTVNQNAGTMIVGTKVVLGDSKDPFSTFNGGGVYYQSGGVLRTPELNVGSHVTATGSFNLSGGSLDVTDLYVGRSGVGVFNQTGGISTPTQLRIGTNLVSPPPGTNTYNMNGGSLSTGATTITKNGRFNYAGGSTWLGHLNLYENARVDINGPGLQTYTMHYQPLNAPAMDAVIDIKGFGWDLGFTGFEQIDEVMEGAGRGYNGGAWNGKGIISSAAAANSGAAYKTGVGYAPGGIGLLIRHALYGDTDVNGTVDINDFAKLAANFNATGRYWYHGDFDYNGTVNLADFGRFAANFNQSLPALTARVEVPEPVCGLLAAAMLLCRRRGSPVRRELLL